jgi:hypothetical protein
MKVYCSSSSLSSSECGEEREKTSLRDDILSVFTSHREDPRLGILAERILDDGPIQRYLIFFLYLL